MTQNVDKENKEFNTEN